MAQPTFIFHINSMYNYSKMSIQSLYMELFDGNMCIKMYVCIQMIKNVAITNELGHNTTYKMTCASNKDSACSSRQSDQSSLST